MLTQLRCPIRLSFSSTDLLVDVTIETVGTLYQKDHDRYHLLLTEPFTGQWDVLFYKQEHSTSTTVPTPRLLWIEFSAYRVTLTMQGNGGLSYRHLFEPGVFGISRFWLQDQPQNAIEQMRLRNFTRNLHVKGNPFPNYLLLEYELWSQNLKLGDYTLNVEIQH